VLSPIFEGFLAIHITASVYESRVAWLTLLHSLRIEGLVHSFWRGERARVEVASSVKIESERQAERSFMVGDMIQIVLLAVEEADGENVATEL
jgi:hypothetical protein